MAAMQSGAASVAALFLAALPDTGGALAQDASKPPQIDCASGFDTLRIAAFNIAGAAGSAEEDGFEIVRINSPAGQTPPWRAELGFTTPWHPAHPAVTLRTLRLQVTGVWTADSKVCGYSGADKTAALAAEMKAGDKALTDASRDEVEKRNSQRSPLQSPH
ncbi:hypothetical protein APY04_2269 [Hyphomicrobium sulfonivorans]|uniref:Uncharacterized protein n=2 Tax=Hyphomicrobium sulfonivorans TaxID=121290 RepID=A0A109BDU4_HYPSL|nr:hypothetical protein APY04_2269 [Hyphomicrobium sulfonivorans]